MEYRRWLQLGLLALWLTEIVWRKLNTVVASATESSKDLEDKANNPVSILFANRSVVIRIVRQIANSGPMECSGRITQPTKCPEATRLYCRSRKGYTLLFRASLRLSYSGTRDARCFSVSVHLDSIVVYTIAITS